MGVEVAVIDREAEVDPDADVDAAAAGGLSESSGSR
jgi:hypothetical protein